MASHGRFGRLISMIAPGDFIYRDAHYLAADVAIDEVAARRWVPRPLRLALPATASIFTAWFPHDTFGSIYREAGLLLHVLHCGRPAVFSPWMLVDDDVALIVGRELLGYPKKLGAIDFTIDGDRVRGVASRRGSEILRMDGVLGERVDDPPPMLGRPHRNVRATLGLSLPKIIAFTPHEEPIEVRRVDLRLQVSPAERDPIADLGFGAVSAAYLHRVNIGARGLPVPIGSVSPLWYARQLLLRAH